MTESIYSQTLRFVLNMARDMNVGVQSTVTAEKLLLAVLRMQEDRLGFEDRSELEAALSAVNAKLPDTRKAMAMLEDIANASPQETASQVRYMNSILIAAEERVRETADTYLTLNEVIADILSHPDEGIHRVIEAQKPADTGTLSWLSSAISAFDTGKTDSAAPSVISTPSAPPIPPVPPVPIEKDAEAPAESGYTRSGKAPRGVLPELILQVNRIRDNLMQKVFGQDHAIDVVTNGLFHGEFVARTDSERRRPKATFLFAGPPGVGKTFLAESLAKELGLEFVRYDMSEMDPKVMDEKLPKHVRLHPESVILFDEIEKSHPLIIQEFLQVLDLGQLGGSHGVSFKDSVIIFTTNAGRPLYNESANGDFSELSPKAVMKALRDDIDERTRQPFFPEAMLSRFETGNVVMFNRMSADVLMRILKKEIQKQIRAAAEMSGLDITVDDMVYAALLIRHGGNADARIVRAKGEEFIAAELYELYRLLDAGQQEPRRVHISVNLTDAPKTIAELFSEDGKPDVLIFGDEALCAACAGACPQVRFTECRSVEAAQQAIAKKDFQFALVDFAYGIRQTSRYMNDEDILSDGREFFRYLRRFAPEIPIYFVQTPEESYNREERLSLRRRGVRAIVEMTPEDPVGISAQITDICTGLHHQEKMLLLARSGKALTFETGQYLTEDGIAEIELFDFRLDKVLVGDGGAILSDSELPTTRFDDVIGAGEAKEELKTYVDFLENPKSFAEKGIEVPKGVLLYGPPGTGKTMLARALAGEAGVAFLPVTSTDFFKPLVGAGPATIRNLFETARKYAPAVIFIDEIDAIAKERNGADINRPAEELLNTLLTQMDGFNVDPKRPVFVLAATNFGVEKGGSPSGRSLDPALLRRFDRRIKVDLPNKDERMQYLRLRTAGGVFKLSDDLYENIARRSSGMSPADLESVIKMAKRKAFRTGAAYVDDALFNDVFEEFKSGEERRWSDEVMLQTARHEAGHAFAAWYLGEKPTYITVVSRGNYGGYVQKDSGEDRFGHNRQELRNSICISMAGRAAETVYYGKEDGVTTGPGSDLQNATNVALMMLCYYGMVDDFGLAVTEPYLPQSDTLTPEVKAEVNRLLREELQRATDLVAANRPAMDALVEELLQKTHLNGEEMDAILSKYATPEA